MKNIFLALSVLFIFSACNDSGAQKPNYKDAKKIVWLSLEEAQELNKKEPREFVVDVYTEWCGPCKMMDRMTFSDPEIVKLVNDNYYAVKFNGESGDPVDFKGKTYSNPQFREDIPPNRRNAAHELVREFQIRGYPTLILFDSDLNVKKNIVGFKKPAQLMQELKG